MRWNPFGPRGRFAVGDDMSSDKAFSEADFVKRIEAYRKRLRREAKDMCDGDMSPVEDLVQETIYRAWIARWRFRQGSNLWAWLITIMTNLYLDYLKHRRVVRNAEPHIVLLEFARYDMTIVETTDQELREAVAGLEPELRVVVELHYLKERSCREIAKKLGIAVGTVAKRLKRARERLKEMLARTCNKSEKL